MKRFDLSRLNAIVVPLLAGVLGLLVGAVMLLALGANPLGAYTAMGQGTFSSPNAFADTLVKAGPLLFVGIVPPNTLVDDLGLMMAGAKRIAAS